MWKGVSPALWRTIPYLFINTALRDIYENWRRNENLLFMRRCVFAFTSLCLIALLDRLFHPLQQIAETSREMTSGTFNGRLPEKGRDEVAAMAHSFKQMAETIKTQIAELEEGGRTEAEACGYCSFASCAPLRQPFTVMRNISRKAAVSGRIKVFLGGLYQRPSAADYQSLPSSCWSFRRCVEEREAWEKIPGG